MRYVNAWNEERPLSHAVVAGDLVYCSGVRAADAGSERLIGDRGMEARVSRCLDTLDAVLGKAGSSLAGALRMRIFVRNAYHAPLVGNAVSAKFAGKPCPAVTLLEVNRLEGDHDILMDCVAVANGAGGVYVEDEGARPWSRAARHGPYVFCSAVVPAAASLSYDEAQFRGEVAECLARIGQVLKRAGGDVKDIFRTRVYVRNMKDRSVVNHVYRDFFSAYPTRVIAEVPRLPNEQRVCIECDACLGGGAQYLSTSKGQIPTGPFSQGIRIGARVFCSGVRPIDPKTDRLLIGSFRDRTVRCMENLRATLTAGGTTMDAVFEAMVYLRNLADLGTVDDVFREYFQSHCYPARTVIEVSRLNEDYEKGWEPNHDVEIEVSAHDG